ncbi:transcriptional regulator with XRE-family HTH domain [Hamadaea flava]|uniref:Helix-turn-helix domain-containing protein n=1 Tax=Hamadaea flava TaxID=1742688 RepID=A0ABV8LLG4_9ACTN|nr:helix-turn-helix transcriptional regulator [Hamadaea flava]MCP2323608.1 transcriptional regulator with XRE-family HTH domain [Hamadaea flava]
MAASQSELEPDVDRQTQVRKLLQKWRRRLLRSEFPQLPPIGRARPYEHVSQEDMALLTGVTARYYSDLERGERRNFSSGFLERVATILRLDRGERDTIFWLVKSQDPPPIPGRHLHRPTQPPLTPGIRALVVSQPWPAFVVDAAWEILLANEATAMWFDGLAIEGNYMRWMFLNPAAQWQIGEWQEIARLMLRQLTAQHARLPHHECIQSLIQEILDGSEVARRWWRSDPGVWLHEDGNERTLFLPTEVEPAKPTIAEIVSMEPLRDSQLRAFWVVPLDGYVPADCAELVAVARADR